MFAGWAMTDLTEHMLFAQVKGPGHVGKPRKVWSDAVPSDIQQLSISHYCCVAQQKSTWRALACSTCT